MNTTKKLITLLVALMALVACNEKDDPTPEVKTESDVYFLVGSYDRDILYNLDGDIIYSSPEGSHIASLQSEGSDWYALVKYEDRPNEVIKNGQSVFTTSQEITEFGVGNGKVFTLQRTKHDEDTYQWSFWEDSKPRYQLTQDKSYSYHNLFVYSEEFDPLHTGHSYFFFLEYADGSTNLLSEFYNLSSSGLETGVLIHGYVTSCDFTPGGFIYCYEDWDTNKNIYSWNDEKRELGFIPTQVRVFDRKPYVLGSKATKQTGSGTTQEPVVVIDGVETILRTDFLPRDLVDGVKMLQHGDDIYILATGRDCCSCIFKNLEPIEVKAKIPNPGYLPDIIQLAHCVYKDFVVVDRPIENWCKTL